MKNTNKRRDNIVFGTAIFLFLSLCMYMPKEMHTASFGDFFDTIQKELTSMFSKN